MITFLEGLKSCNKTQEDVFAFFSNKKKTQVYYYIFSITTSHAGANQKILHMQPFIETLFLHGCFLTFFKLRKCSQIAQPIESKTKYYKFQCKLKHYWMILCNTAEYLECSCYFWYFWGTLLLARIA